MDDIRQLTGEGFITTEEDSKGQKLMKMPRGCANDPQEK